MNKALVTVSDNNKGKFISKGFSSAFRNFSYFVIERKIYDLNIQDINKINPQIIFIFWTDMSQKDVLIDFLKNYKNSCDIIHCAELISDIPCDIAKNKDNYVFASDCNNLLLPSVNPYEYKTKFVKYNYGITFAGNPATLWREKVLSALILNFGAINIFCRSYDFYKSIDEIYKEKLLNDYFLELYKSSYKGCVESQKKLAEIYASSKINIDIKSENEKYINYRCLEAMASGGFVIAPYNKTAVKYFDDGKDFETYATAEELTDKVRFYLKNLNIVRQIAANGRRNTISNHSFCGRLKSMLEVIYGEDIGYR